MLDVKVMCGGSEAVGRVQGGLDILEAGWWDVGGGRSGVGRLLTRPR